MRSLQKLDEMEAAGTPVAHSKRQRYLGVIHTTTTPTCTCGVSIVSCLPAGFGSIRLYCHVCEQQYLCKSARGASSSPRLRNRRSSCTVRTSAHVIVPPASLIIVFLSASVPHLRASDVAQGHVHFCGGRQRATAIKTSRDIPVRSLQTLGEMAATPVAHSKRQRYLSMIHTTTTPTCTCGVSIVSCLPAGFGGMGCARHHVLSAVVRFR